MDRTSDAVEEVHKTMNSRLDQLIKEITSRVRAEGFAAGTLANPGDVDPGKTDNPVGLQEREETT